MNSAPAVAVYAGSFDPPGVHHREIAELLGRRYGEVVVLPAGPRTSAEEQDSYPIHRAVMADLNFTGLPNVRVDLDDLEDGRFTHHHQFRDRYGRGGEVSHVVPAATVRGAAEKNSRIHLDWEEGERLFQTEHFTVLRERAEPVDADDLPPNHTLLDVPAYSPSNIIRSMLFDNDPGADGLLAPRVADYLRRHGLFRATPPARECLFCAREPRLKIFHDPRNPKSIAVAEALRKYEHPEPELIAVSGGDGTMLRAILKHWRDRLPFYGINTGTLGFLLNERGEGDFWKENLRLYQLPLLWVTTVGHDGSEHGSLAFNDCWVERETGQTAWIEISVNGEVRLPKVVADGMLVATAAGSTSYARAMRATPLPFNAGLLTLAGSNVLMPEFWSPAVLTMDTVVKFRNLDPNKRPLRAFVDGRDRSQVLEMTVRVSNTAAVELLFNREHDPVTKLARLQFPKVGG